MNFPVVEINRGVIERQHWKRCGLAAFSRREFNTRKLRSPIQGGLVRKLVSAHQGWRKTTAMHLHCFDAQSHRPRETTASVVQYVRPRLVDDAQTKNAVLHLIQIKTITIAPVGVEDTVPGGVAFFIQIPCEHTSAGKFPAPLSLPEKQCSAVSCTNAPAVTVALDHPEFVIGLRSKTISTDRHEHFCIANNKGVVIGVGRNAAIGATFNTHDIETPAATEWTIARSG